MSDEQEADAVDADAGDDEGEPDDTGEELASGEGEEEREEEEASEQDAAADEEGLQEGDFVRLEYTIRTVENGHLVDTTDPDIADEEDIETEGREFGPRTIALGGGYLFDEVEDDLIGKSAGDTGQVRIAAENAFGEYDPGQVRTISADRIQEDDRYPGAHVHIDGESGHVETVIGGRARVDFNHPLAGEDLEYEYEVVETVGDRIERAKGLLGMYLDSDDLSMSIGTEEEEQAVDDEEADGERTETIEREVLYIEATPQMTMNQRWMFSKQQIAQELIERIGVDRVIVQEILEGMGGMGGLGGLEGADLEGLMEEADIDDIDAEELADELEGEIDGGGDAGHDHEE